MCIDQARDCDQPGAVDHFVGFAAVRGQILLGSDPGDQAVTHEYSSVAPTPVFIVESGDRIKVLNQQALLGIQDRKYPATIESELYTEVRMQGSPVSQSFAGQLIVGEGVAISGTLSIPGRVVIEGSLEGELQADELLVYPKGVVSAKVRVRTADVHGTTRQALEVAGYLCIRSTGRVHDRITCGEIEIERGGIVSGSVSFSGLPAEAPAAQASPAPASPALEAENLPSFAHRLTGT